MQRSIGLPSIERETASKGFSKGCRIRYKTSSPPDSQIYSSHSAYFNLKNPHLSFAASCTISLRMSSMEGG